MTVGATRRSKDLERIDFRMRDIFALTRIAAGLVSCADSGTRNEGVLSIGTRENAYHVAQPIAVDITNSSSEAIGVATCCLTNPDLRIQHQVDSDWTAPGICELGCASLPLRIGFADQIVDTIKISDPGWYRLMLRYTTGTTNPISDSFFSNEFEVR